MSGRRKQMRRAQCDADRRCATVADLEHLDRHCRRLSTDFPSFKRAMKKAEEAGKELSEAQIEELLSDVIHVSWEEAQPMLCSIRKSREFRRWKRQLDAHPGIESDLAPEVLILAMIRSVEIKGSVHRTIVCQIINGMDSRIWHFVGMCSRTTREPVSFNMIQRQLQRVEQFPQITQTPIHLS